LRCARISGQARACAGVGAGNWPANQAATAGWNESGITSFSHFATSGTPAGGKAINPMAYQGALR